MNQEKKLSLPIALLICALPIVARGQWTDLTKPPESTSKAIPVITPRLTALTHSGEASGLAFSPDGKMLVVLGGEFRVPQVPQPGNWSDEGPQGSATAGMIAAADRNESSGPASPGRNTSPSGRYLGRLVQESTGLLAMDTQSGRLHACGPKKNSFEERNLCSVIFAAHGKSVFVSNERETMLSWNISDNSISKVPMPDGCRCAFFARSPVESKLIVRNWPEEGESSDGGGRAMYLLDAAQRKTLGKIEVPDGGQHGIHNMGACGIDFSPDAKQFAVGFTLWDMQSGKMIQEMPHVEEGGDLGYVHGRTIKFSPDGKSVIGYDSGNNLLIWDTKANRVEYAFNLKRLHRKQPYYDERIRSVAFSPDGKWMVGTDRELVRLWHFPTRDLVATLVGNVNTVTVVAFSSDGKTVASAGSDGTTRLWDVSGVLSSIKESELSQRSSYYEILKVTSPRETESRYHGVVFSPDGKCVAAVCDGQATIWDVISRTEKVSLALPLFYGSKPGYQYFSFLPDRNLIVYRHRSSPYKAHVFDLDSRNEVRDVGKDIEVMAMSSDGKWIAGICDHEEPYRKGSDVKVYEVHSGGEVSAFPVGADITSLRFSPDGKYLAVGRKASDEDDGVTLWNTASWTKVGSCKPPQWGAATLTFSADSKSLAVVGNSETCFSQVPTLKKQAVMSHSNCFDLAFTSDLAFAAGYHPHQIEIWDCKRMKPLGRFGLPPQGEIKRLSDLAFSPDDRILASVQDDDSVILWDWIAAVKEEGW